jgi:glycine/D-amino acid oxidase-like deaminating enzyme
VFVAAGIHTARLLGLDDVIYLKTSVIVTAPIPKLLEKQWLNKHAFWTSEEPGYTYGKITADNRILFGGEDTLVSPDEFSNKAENIAALKKKFKKLLPQFADVPIDYSWSGIIDVSPDLLPIVGKIKNGIYVAHSSLGLPSGFNSGRMVAASIAGENVPEMKLFSPTRKLPLHERAELLCNHKPFLWVANWYVRYKEHEND